MEQRNYRPLLFLSNLDMLRQEFRMKNIHSIIYPRFYKYAQVNDVCPYCSGKKYERCCMSEV